MRHLEQILNAIAKRCNDEYGKIDGGFSFDHQISVADRVAMDVRWKRVDPAIVGDGRRQAHKERMRFRLSARHDKVFDLYALVPFMVRVLNTNGFVADVPLGDVENGERVEIDIFATQE